MTTPTLNIEAITNAAAEPNLHMDSWYVGDFPKGHPTHTLPPGCTACFAGTAAYQAGLGGLGMGQPYNGFGSGHTHNPGEIRQFPDMVRELLGLTAQEARVLFYYSDVTQVRAFARGVRDGFYQELCLNRGDTGEVSDVIGFLVDLYVVTDAAMLDARRVADAVVDQAAVGV